MFVLGVGWGVLESRSELLDRNKKKSMEKRALKVDGIHISFRRIFLSSWNKNAFTKRDKLLMHARGK